MLVRFVSANNFFETKVLIPIHNLHHINLMLWYTDHVDLFSHFVREKNDCVGRCVGRVHVRDTFQSKKPHEDPKQPKKML